MVRHSREDALDRETFRRLLDAADTLEEPFDAEARFILIAAGRLGMRAGEISHCKEDWVNWERKMIEIPRHEPCTSGENDGICGYCRSQSQQALEYDPSKSIEAELEERWKPKTENSARPLPFDFDEEVEATVTAFFERWDEYPHSRVSVNRRVDRVAQAADVNQLHVYPHALRATAASHHSFRGLRSAPLQAFFGWERLQTARSYVRSSGSATAEALHDVHGEN